MSDLLQTFTQEWSQCLVVSSCHGSIVILIVFAACRMPVHIPASLRCWLWRAAAIKMLVLLLLPVSIPLAVLPAEQQADENVTSENAAPTALNSLSSTETPALVRDVTTWDAASQSLDVGRLSPEERSALSHAEDTGYLKMLSPGLLICWLVALMVAAVLVLRSLVSVGRIRRSAVALKDASLMEITWNCAEQFGLSHIPRVLESRLIRVPAVAGFWRPVILIPSGVLPGATSRQIRMILAHEMAHIQRRDLMWNWLDLCFGILFFFHPLVWVALRELRLDRETACDELAVRKTSVTPQEYGDTLLAVIRDNLKPRRRVALTVSVVESASTLRRRLLQMRHFNTRSSAFARSWNAGILLVTAVLVLPWQPVARSMQPVEPNLPFASSEPEPEPEPIIASEPKSEPEPEPVAMPVAEPEPVQDKDLKYQTFNEAWGVGATFYNSRNFDAAKAPLEAALRMAPDDAARLKVYEALIPCYRLEKKPEAMMEAVEYVLKNSQRVAQKSLTSRGFLSFLYQRGEIPAAVKRYEMWLEKDPNDPVALLLLTEIYTRIQENPKRATELLERLRKITPDVSDDPAAILQQARLAGQFIRSRDYKSGAELYEQLVDRDAKLAGYYLKEAALARMKLGEKDKALTLARRAVEAGPDTRTEQLTHFWSRHLGEFLLEHGNAAEAIPLLEQALKTTQIEGYLKDTQAKLDEAKKKAGVSD